jgi:hypothetical protein
MSDLISEGWATTLRSLAWKATLCWSLLAGAGCSVQVFARVDDPVRAEGVSLALDDHMCDFQDNSDSGDEPTLDLTLMFRVRNGASSRVTIRPSRISLVIRGRAYPQDTVPKDFMLRPRSSRDFQTHFSFDGEVSCASNLAVTTEHVVELDGRDLPFKPLISFQPSDQDAD